MSTSLRQQEVSRHDAVARAGYETCLLPDNLFFELIISSKTVNATGLTSIAGGHEGSSDAGCIKVREFSGERFEHGAAGLSDADVTLAGADAGAAAAAIRGTRLGPPC
jgi:hypothetical protein